MSITLRAKKVKEGFSLYLDIYEKGERVKEHLNIYVSTDYTKEERRVKKIDKFQWKAAIQITKERQQKALERGTPFLNKITFTDYLKEAVKAKDNQSYTYAFKHFDSYFGTIKFNELTKSKLELFKKFLLENTTNNTTHIYLNRIRIIWKEAKDEGIISINPFFKFKIPSLIENEKQYLTIEEVTRISTLKWEATAIQEQVRSAFVFACFTGLRRSDIGLLKWSHIHDGFLQKPQKKGGRTVRIPIHPTAKKILSSIPRNPNNAFIFPYFNKYSSNVNTVLKRIAKKADITKNVTFHTSRHSCASILRKTGSDIFLVSSILGHSSVDVTKIYTHLSDNDKKEAFKRIKEIPFS